jgi:hypothetical protein
MYGRADREKRKQMVSKVECRRMVIAKAKVEKLFVN